MRKDMVKNFNAMLNDRKDMPKIKILTDEKIIKKYGGEKMLLAPPIFYDIVMKKVPIGKILTATEIRKYLARTNNADFTDPMTAGIFISIAAWASFQHDDNSTPYWRTVKAHGELNDRYPGGVSEHRRRLEAEGIEIICRGAKKERLFVKDYEERLFSLENACGIELWDGYNEDKTLAGVDLIRGAACPPNIFHAVAEVIVRHKDGDFLVMRRAFTKETYAGCWELGASGSVLKGESIDDGAIRELYEETGIKTEKLKTMSEELKRYTNGINAIYRIYLCETDIDKNSIVLQEGETIDFKWVARDKLFSENICSKRMLEVALELD